MTLEKDSFEGLMGSLNLDANEFINYKIHEDLNYQQLSLIKSDIETQLTKLFDLMTNSFNVTMDTPLLTNDGYPRDDIDLVSIRLIRVKIIRLRNDHTKILSMIEQKLIDQFNNPTTNTDPQSHDDDGPESINKLLEAKIPFARVEEIIDQSPASQAGLNPGDKIIVFDNNIHVGNHNRLTAVVNRVKDNIDQPLTVHITRGDTNISAITLTPTKNWNGNGLLGCKIIPL